MVFRQIMLGRFTHYFNTPLQRHLAQAACFRNSQVTGVQSIAIYSCFPAKLADFSKVVEQSFLYEAV